MKLNCVWSCCWVVSAKRFVWSSSSSMSQWSEILHCIFLYELNALPKPCICCLYFWFHSQKNITSIRMQSDGIFSRNKQIIFHHQMHAMYEQFLMCACACICALSSINKQQEVIPMAHLDFISNRECILKIDNAYEKTMRTLLTFQHKQIYRIINSIQYILFT